MPKPALGRGLGNLLGDTQIARQPEPTSLPLDDTAPAEISPGLGNLLRGGKTEETGEPSAPDASSPAASLASIYPAAAKMPLQPLGEPPAEPIQVPRWSLVAADLLLVVLASLLVFRSPAPLKAWEMVICVSALAIGALLACAAVLRDPPRK